jgi:hypothetical protein
MISSRSTGNDHGRRRCCRHTAKLAAAAHQDHHAYCRQAPVDPRTGATTSSGPKQGTGVEIVDQHLKKKRLKSFR